MGGLRREWSLLVPAIHDTIVFALTASKLYSQLKMMRSTAYASYLDNSAHASRLQVHLASLEAAFVLDNKNTASATSVSSLDSFGSFFDVDGINSAISPQSSDEPGQEKVDRSPLPRSREPSAHQTIGKFTPAADVVHIAGLFAVDKPPRKKPRRVKPEPAHCEHFGGSGPYNICSYTIKHPDLGRRIRWYDVIECRAAGCKTQYSKCPDGHGWKRWVINSSNRCELYCGTCCAAGRNGKYTICGGCRALFKYNTGSRNRRLASDCPRCPVTP